MNWRRRLVLAAVIAVVVAALVYGFLPKPVAVEVASARRGGLKTTVEEEGMTRVINRFVVSAPVAGYARRITLDVGDRVKKGQVLSTLEPQRSRVLDPRTRAEAVARVASSEAALKAAGENAVAAKADAVYAAGELKRIEGLYRPGYASKEKFEQAVADARRMEARSKAAEFAVDVASFDLDAARTALRYSGGAGGGETPAIVYIRSPINGNVLKKHRESEGSVGEGQPLIELGDPRALEVVVDVLSSDAVRIKPGNRVLFERWGGQAPLEGRVRVVEPAGFTKVSALGVEEQRVNVVSEFTSPIDAWERLGDGYRVIADFIIWEGGNILQVPTSSLFRHGDGWAIFAVKDGRARLRAVRTGHAGGMYTEIIDGVEEGDSVITHPGDAVSDGVRVRVR